MSDVATQVRRVTRRIRIRRAVEAFARMAVVGLALALLVLLVWKLGRLSGTGLRAWLAVAAGLPIAGAVFAAARKVPEALAAKLVDLRFGLDDRTGSAVEFGAVPAGERTAFMEAALRDAEARVAEVRSTDAVPLRAPKDVLPATALAAAVIGLTFVAFPRPKPQVVESNLVPFEVHEEELEAYREYARDLLARADDEQAGPLHDAAEALNRLVEDLADRRVDREEAFRRLGELEDRFLRGDQASPEELERALRAIGDELRRSELTKEIGQKLQDSDLAKAREEVQKLAQALRDERPESQKALERAREALQRAAQENPSQDVRERLEELRREMQEQQESLLKKKQEKNGQDEAEERLLKRRQRELERLERQEQMSDNLRRQLDRLQREMDRTAETLNQSPQEAAEAMERMAEELNRLAQDQEAQEELARMLERMQDMREMLRRQRGQGRDQEKRAGQLGKFYQLARGRQGMRIAGPGQQGQEGQDGQQGQGGEQAKMLQLGEGSDQLLMPLPGMGQSAPGQGQMPGGPQQGQGIGTEHDPRMGDPTNLNGRRETMQVQGTPNEDGATRSQVIMGAADQGFASQGYHRVYGEYRRVMEEDLDLQDIPPGVRGHLRDYMDLIRPQE